MTEQIDKQTYKGIVKFTLQSMLDLSKEDKSYNLQMDAIHYYESTIKKENIITMEEFLDLCKEIGIK